MSECLTPVAELPLEAGESLLLGNGFSLALCPAFDYRSLFEKAIELGFVKSPLSGVFEAFEEEGGYDFEHALAQLWTASQVAKVLRLETEPYSSAYSQVRDALLRSVRAVHPRHSEIDSTLLSTIGERLSSSYRKVFTTSYDLLLYWCMAMSGFRPFVDFFWKEGAFNPASKVQDDQVPVYFLHGALHLYSRDGVVGKLAGGRAATILDGVDERWQRGDIPLFVSEGQAKQKLDAINRSSYLSWVAHRFLTIEGGLTIFGSSLGSTDKHLVEWICSNRRLRHVAVSVHAREGDQEKAILEYRLKLADFATAGGKLYYVSSGELARRLGLESS